MCSDPMSNSLSQQPFLVGSNSNEAAFYALRYARQDQFTLNQTELNEIGYGFYSCPTALDAAVKSAEIAASNPPIYRYEYFGDWPNLRLFPGSGAYHTSETSMVFGTMEDLSGQPNTDLQVLVSRYMQHVWATFARDPVDGLSNLGWPTYNASAETLVRLGYRNETTASYVAPAPYDKICQTLGILSS